MTYINPSGWPGGLLAGAIVLLAGFLSPGTVAPRLPETRMYDSILDDPRVQDLGMKGLDHLYNMERDQAAAYFDQIEKLYPGHPVGPFLRGLNIWWDVMVDLPAETHDEAFFDEMDSAVRRANRMLKRNREDFDAMFFKGAALGFSGRLKSNRGRWFKAALDGKNALDYVLAIAEKEDQNADFGFGKAIYDYFSVVIPEEYPVVRPFMVFMPGGDKERGIANLKRTVDEGHFIRTEAAYFLLQIYYSYERNFDKSLEYVKWLRREHPRNSFFHTYEGRVYFRWGRWSEAQTIFEDIIERHDEGLPGYSQTIVEQALYYLARTHMVYRRHDEALPLLKRIELMSEQADGSSVFKVLAFLRLGMVYDAQGNRSEAIRYYQAVLRLDDWSGAHDRAKRYLDAPYRG
jgi:tetratricopeptide (TPR) repeat protein